MDRISAQPQVNLSLLRKVILEIPAAGKPLNKIKKEGHVFFALVGFVMTPTSLLTYIAIASILITNREERLREGQGR